MFFNLNKKIPFVYLEMGRLRMQSSSLVFVNSSQTVSIPAGRVSSIFLGPGTTITDGAVKYCMKVKAMIVWVGEDITKCYSMIPTANQSSENFLRQVELYTKKFDTILKRYYEIRFNRRLISIGKITVEKVRGIEGSFMKKAYMEYAKKYGVPYSGRMRESEWDKNTIYNRVISICNSFLYGTCCSVIVSLGYSTALGILHTGDMLSFVYDIADVYKIEYSILMGFQLGKELSDNKIDPSKIDSEIRKRALGKLRELNIINRIITDIEVIFNGSIPNKKSFRDSQKIACDV